MISLSLSSDGLPWWIKFIFVSKPSTINTWEIIPSNAESII